MEYITKLDHESFVLILETLRKAEEEGIIAWSATALICEKTTIKY